MPEPTVIETPVAPSIPEKFMKDGKPDYNALVNSYNELEKKQGTLTPKAPEVPVVPPKAETPVTPPVPEVPAPQAPKAFEKFEQEFMEKGELAPESYTELESKFNLPKDVVNDFIKFRQESAEKYASDVVDVMGGVDNYNQMVQWADKNLTKEAQSDFNKAVQSGDLNVAKVAVAGMKTSYEKAMGKDPNLLGGGVGNQSKAPFNNIEEAVAFKSNKRWNTDPDYQREYKQRLANAKF